MTQTDSDPPAGATERVLLTRESIQSGRVHELIAAHGLEMRVLSADELAASLRSTLASPTSPTSRGRSAVTAS